MKKTTNRSLPFKHILAAAVFAGVVLPSQGQLNISISGTSQTRDTPIIDFLNANFSNIGSISYGDYSNPANIPAGTGLFIIGRNLSSGAYDNAANSATFNALNIPVVSFTSYVTRTAGNRWSWESGDLFGPADPTGSETGVTAAGTSIFGVSAGNYDWYNDTGTGFGLGTGTVGTGHILATIGSNILAAGWTAGEQSAGGATFSANRLLFNSFQVTGGINTAILPQTAAGQQGLINALAAYTPLTPVPEPSGIALFSLSAVGWLLARRRRTG